MVLKFVPSLMFLGWGLLIYILFSPRIIEQRKAEHQSCTEVFEDNNVEQHKVIVARTRGVGLLCLAIDTTWESGVKKSWLDEVRQIFYLRLRGCLKYNKEDLASAVGDWYEGRN